MEIAVYKPEVDSTTSYGLVLSYPAEGLPTLQLPNQTGVNGVNTNYAFTVNGFSYFTNNIQLGDLTNSNRKICFYDKDRNFVWMGYANDNGNFYLYDSLNQKSILSNRADGTNYFNGGVSYLNSGYDELINRLYIRTSTGTKKDYQHFMFIQADCDNGYVNIGIDGQGPVGVNKARADGNGNVITSTYLPFSGGTMTGSITMEIGTGLQMAYTISSTTGDPWIYAKSAPTYGIRYYEGNPDVMAISASGNNNTKTGADLALNAHGDGTLSTRNNRIPHTGNATGTVGYTNNPVYIDAGQIKTVNWFCNDSGGEHNANNITSNGVYYYTSNGPSTGIGATATDGSLYAQAYNSAWVTQIAQDYRNGRLFVRSKNSGNWTSWVPVIVGSHGSSLPSTGAMIGQVFFKI